MNSMVLCNSPSYVKIMYIQYGITTIKNARCARHRR